MEEYRVDVKVRNNVILKKIEQAGYKTVCEFCRLNNIMKYVATLGSVISMKLSPLNRDGEFISCIVYIAELLGCNPDDLFTDTQMHTLLKSNKRSIEVNEAEMKFMLSQQEQPKLLEQIIEDEQRNDAIEQALDSLSDRSKKMICMRLGLHEYDHEYTFAEIAQEFSISVSGARGIVENSFRILRKSQHAKNLAMFQVEH